MSFRSALTTNLPVKITSVVLSLFLWFLAAGEENASTLLPVDLAIRAPAGRSLLQPPGPLRALVVGPRRELLKLSATPLRLSRSLSDTILAGEVHLDLDPGDLEVPLGAISVVPGTVRLMGSRVQLQALDSARTEPLEIARADGPVEDVVKLDTSRFGTVRAMPQEVSIRVDVEAVGSRTIPGAPIRLASTTARALRPDQETVRVLVSGASGRLAALDADSLFIVVDGAEPWQPGRVRLRVIAPAGVAARAEPDSVDLVPRSGRG